MAVNYKIRKVNNKRFPEEKPCYCVSLVTRKNTNRDQLADHLSELSSFSRGDLTGILDNLVLLMSNELAKGNTVTLDGLGTFSLSAEMKDPSMDVAKIDGRNITLKKVCFKPAPEFKKRINTKIKFEKLDPKLRRLR